jgi:hypothetical protein
MASNKQGPKGPSLIGSTAPNAGPLAGFIDPSGNINGGNLDGSGNIKVVVTGAGSGGTSSVDESAFSAGVTAGTPAMGVYEVTPSTLTDGQLGVVAVDANRNVKVNIVAGSSGNGAAGPTGDPVPAQADYQGFQNPSGDLEGVATENLDYDTGAGTQPQTGYGVLIPASGGPLPVLGGHGTAAQALRVELPTDGTGVIATVGAVTAISSALPAGTNVIGHVIADSGSTTAVTGNVTVVQGTATNLKAQVVGAGTAGIADAGVVTVQGIASMTPLLVTPAANSAVNLAQVNGATVNVGAGNAGTGTARVSISTDDVNLAAINAVSGTTSGAAVITDANGTIQQYLRGLVKLAITAGGFLVTATIGAGTALIGKVAAANAYDAIYNGTTALTPKFATISTSSSGASTLVAAVTSKKIVVTDIVLVANAAVNVKFQSHVTPTDLTGLLYLAANTGFAPGYDPTGHFQTVAGEALDINLSGAVAVGGWLKYIEV